MFLQIGHGHSFLLRLDILNVDPRNTLLLAPGEFQHDPPDLPSQWNRHLPELADGYDPDLVQLDSCLAAYALNLANIDLPHSDGVDRRIERRTDTSEHRVRLGKKVGSFATVFVLAVRTHVGMPKICRTVARWC